MLSVSVNLAQIWTASFLDQKVPDNFVVIRKDLLDDSNAAKDEMDKVCDSRVSFILPGAYVYLQYRSRGS